MTREDEERSDRLKGVIALGALGAGAGVLHAHYSKKEDYFARAAIGALVGLLGGACVRALRGESSSGSHVVGWSPPPHPIEVMPQFDPSGLKSDQARAVLSDYFHDDNLRNWFDKGEVKHAFGVKETPDYDPTALIAAYENPRDRVWTALGHDQATSLNELRKNVDLAIARRKKLGKLPKASYDKDPVIIYYYDHDRMKKVEYARAGLPAMLNPNNHYYWRDPSVKTYETQNPAAIRDEQQHPGRPGNNKWDNEGFDWNKDAVGSMNQIVSTTLQLVGFAMQLTGYAAAVGSAISQASPYIGTLAGIVDDAFQGNDNSKAVGAIAKMILTVANKGLGEVVGTELPPAAMQVLGQGVDAIGQTIAAGQKEHLDYQGIWTKVLAKSKSFHKIGDAEARTIKKILGENSAGSTFMQGYQAGKLTDLATIDAISKMFNNQGNANVWMLGAGLGQLAVRQGATAPHPASRGTAVRK